MLSNSYRHSASSANKYYESPSAWLYRYGFDVKEKTNDKMARGLASEVGANAGLTQNLTEKHIPTAAVDEFDKIYDGKRSDERSYVGPTAYNFVCGLREFGKPLTYQDKLLKQVSGLNREIIGYTDFGYEDLIVDTKATLACPSNIFGFRQAAAVRQQAVYAKLSGKKTALLYATPRKFALYRVPLYLIERGWVIMFDAFKAIEALDNLVITPEEAAKIIPLNPDSFYWTDESYKLAQEKWSS